MVDFLKNNEIYLIGEIGINHNGDMQIAKKLIDAVNACGWNCAKFQKRTPEDCVPAHQWQKIRQTPWGDMSYIDYKKKIEFGKKEYDIIDNYSSEKPIDWTASVWDIKSLEFLAQYDKIPFIKIPSAMMTNKQLVTETAKLGKPVVISTGMSTLKQVDEAINNLKKYTNDIIIMHTNSSYPTPIEELNLKLIPFLKNRYDCTIGYSGHEEDLEPTVIAVSLGAKIIERHITIDRNMWGTDQKSSLSVHGMDMLKKRIENINKMFGNGIKEITKSELPILTKLRG